MKLPNLKHLHYLVILHKEQHFNRAALRCNVSQSTLSAAIQNLEESLNTQLLERDHKAFVFTSFGEALVEKSRVLLNSAYDWSEFATSLGNWESGTVKLGVIPTIAPFLFEPLINRFHNELPNINLQLQEDTTEHLMAQLQEGELDLLVLALPIKTPGCKQLVIGQDPFHFIVHNSMEHQLALPINVNDLPKNSIFLLQKEHCLTEHAVSACGLKHKEQVSSLSASSLHTLVALVNNKMGMTFLPEMAINCNILKDAQVSVMPAEQGAYREIGLVWRNGTTRVQLFRYIGDILSPLMPVPSVN